jgi:hypothetical protein
MAVVQSLLKLGKWHTDLDRLWLAADVSLNRFNNGMANSNVNTRMHQIKPKSMGQKKNGTHSIFPV